jgi:hypothetical protein
MWARRVGRLWILAVGWLAFLAYCYPGYMSNDSAMQLAQARGLDPMSNWHPPVMAYLWKVCDAIWPGPFLMLVIQSWCLLAGMYLILRKVLSVRGAQFAAVLILLSPPVLMPMGVIWKDSQMAGFLVLAIALLPTQRVAACALVWLATAQRYNAAAATLPVLLLLFVWKPELARWKRYVIAAVVWLAITASAMAVTGVLADQHEDVFASLAGNDIIGVIRFADYTDDQLRRDAPGLPWMHDTDLAASARAIYRPYFTWLDWAGDRGVIRYPHTADESAAIASAWRRMVVKHPIAYLEHRIRVFFTEIRVTHRHNFYIWCNMTDGPWTDERLDLHHRHTAIQEVWIDFLVLLEGTPVYWAWVYLVGGLALCYLLRRDRYGLTIAASGVLCELGLFVVAPAIDYRYSHWMVTCTLVAAVYYVGLRRARS